MSIPENHFIGASFLETFSRGIDFAGQELAHLLVLRIGLVLTANARRPLGVGDQENCLAGLR
jgi:hypothetical protein